MNNNFNNSNHHQHCSSSGNNTTIHTTNGIGTPKTPRRLDIRRFTHDNNNSNANANSNNAIQSPKFFTKATSRTPIKTVVRHTAGIQTNSNYNTGFEGISNNNSKFKSIQSPHRNNDNNNNNSFDDPFFNSQQRQQEEEVETPQEGQPAYIFELSDLNNSGSLSSISSFDHIHTNNNTTANQNQNLLHSKNDKKSSSNDYSSSSNNQNNYNYFNCASTTCTSIVNNTTSHSKRKDKEIENQIQRQNIIQMYEQIKRDTYSFPKSSSSTTTKTNPPQQPQRQRSRSQGRSIVSTSTTVSASPSASSKHYHDNNMNFFNQQHPQQQHHHHPIQQQRRSRSLSSKRGERRKGRSKINDAEIENVILKQILASSFLLNTSHPNNNPITTATTTATGTTTNNTSTTNATTISNPTNILQNDASYYLSNLNILKHNSSFSDDISVATSTHGGGMGSASVVSTFTTRDILGDLTDQEDHYHIIKSVVVGGGGGCVGSSGGIIGIGGSVGGNSTGSRGRRSATTSNINGCSKSKLIPSSSSGLNDISNSFHNNNNNNSSSSGSSKKGRSKSVVSRRIRLKDGVMGTGGGEGTTAADESSSSVLGGGESTQLFDSFMKNLSVDLSSQQHLDRKFDSFMKNNLSIDSSSQQQHLDSCRCSSSINGIMKKIGSNKKQITKGQFQQQQYHHDSEISPSVTKWNPFEHSFEVETNNQDHSKSNNNMMMTKPSLKRLSSTPVKSSFDTTNTKASLTKPTLDRHTSLPKYNDFDLFPSTSPTFTSKRTTFSSSKSDFQPSSSLQSSTLTDRNSLVKAVYSLTECNAITKKSRPKQFIDQPFDDRQGSSLSPVRLKKSSSPIARINGNDTSGNSGSSNGIDKKMNVEKQVHDNMEFDFSLSSKNNDWTAFSSDIDVKVGTSKNDNVTNHPNNDFASWASFTDHNSNNKFASSSMPKSKINPSWKTNPSPFGNDKVDESNNDYGFKVIENSSLKQKDHFSHDLFKDFGKNCSDDMTGWDEFDDTSLISGGDAFVCDVSKHSASTIPIRGSPKVLKYGGSSKLEKATTTPSTIVSSNRSFQNYSSESLFSSSKLKSSPTLLKGSRRDTATTISGWSNDSPSGVADFHHKSRKSSFFQ